MSTEEQARRHFLEEAETYFEHIETVILNLNGSDQPIQELDKAMRAAHSVKGTAGMMGFMPLSDLAHQLEDYFKILRARNLTLETDVETLLLQGLDGLRTVRQWLYDDHPIDQDWHRRELTPVFEQLRHHLGELTPEDETSLLSAESEVDVSVLVFSNGVEAYLDQLESQRSHLSGNALRQELITGASQLLDYGLMAEMDAFIDLCQSVMTHGPMVVEADLDAFADTVIQAWQRSHSLVLLGRIDQLPASLNMSPFTLTSIEALADPIEALADPIEALANPIEALADPIEALADPIEGDGDTDALTERDITEADLSQLTAQLTQLDLDSLDTDAFAPVVDPIEINAGPIDEEIDPDELLSLSETLDQIDVLDPSVPLTEPAGAEGHVHAERPLETISTTQVPSVTGAVEILNTLLRNSQSMRLPIAELAQQTDPQSIDANTVSTAQSSETSVRVPVSQLHAINQLLSSLLLDRNAINLRVDQLKTFSELLKQRVGEIDTFNTQLRQWYDRTSIESIYQTPLAATQNIQGEMRGGILAPSAPLSGITTLARSPVQTEVKTAMKDFDALEMDHYSDLHLLAQDQMETIVKLQEVAADINLGVQEITQAAGRLNYTSRSLQDQVSRTQMRPFEDIVGRFPRLIRDLSVQYGKQVNLTIEGSTTLFERYALDRLTDPLIHLLRNAFDHGIEAPDARQQQGKAPEGQILLKATNRGNRAVITISDDGRGIDVDKIRDRVRNYGIPDTQVQQMSRQELLSLIFEPGFSTAEHVTDLSGRGVGMDVVRANLQPIKGDIQVDTTWGQGTTFTITIPLSLSVVRVMILEHRTMIFALTIDDVQEMLPFYSEKSMDPQNPGMMVWKNRSIPLIQLEDYLHFNSSVRSVPLAGTPTIDRPIVVIVGDRDNPYGVLLKRFWKEQDVVMQPIATPIPLSSGFSGATVLGDGRIIPLMDSQQLGALVTEQKAQIDPPQTTEAFDPLDDTRRSQSAPLAIESVQPPTTEGLRPTAKPTILVVDDSIHARRYLAISLEKAGYLTEQATDGQDALDLLNAGLQVQAIICDVEMPRIDGYGVLDTLKSQPQFQDLPIMMLTSRSSDKHRKLAMNLGASAYFSKPYNEQELMQTLTTLVQA